MDHKLLTAYTILFLCTQLECYPLEEDLEFDFYADAVQNIKEVVENIVPASLPIIEIFSDAAQNVTLSIMEQLNDIIIDIHSQLQESIVTAQRVLKDMDPSLNSAIERWKTSLRHVFNDLPTEFFSKERTILGRLQNASRTSQDSMSLQVFSFDFLVDHTPEEFQDYTMPDIVKELLERMVREFSSMEGIVEIETTKITEVVDKAKTKLDDVVDQLQEISNRIDDLVKTRAEVLSPSDSISLQDMNSVLPNLYWKLKEETADIFQEALLRLALSTSTLRQQSSILENGFMSAFEKVRHPVSDTLAELFETVNSLADEVAQNMTISVDLLTGPLPVLATIHQQLSHADLSKLFELSYSSPEF